ncbi:hypothetical protein ABW20_dc0104737 [Dactylellina cionopaga]|nr:hypothetical protein ABW20_dc0104737 [Dactylellina cionopaga]
MPENMETSNDERSDVPKLQFARFKNRKIELFQAQIKGTDYIAISHVWGEAKWLPVASAEHDILVSKKKANFITRRLPELIGQSSFWMDVICIDQRDQKAVLAAAQLSVEIFRNANKTIAIRAGDGYFKCCAESIAGGVTYEDIRTSLINHVTKKHWGTKFWESYLRRLWTLQEIVWSDKVQFVTDDYDTDLDSEFNALDIGSDTPKCPDTINNECYDAQTSTSVLLDSLFIMACSFLLNPKGIGKVIEFMKAFMQNGLICRDSQFVRNANDDIYTHDFLQMHAESIRSTTNPADLLLATMLQFSWYSAPINLLASSFSELFLDFYEQSSASGHPLTCRITRSMTHDNLNEPLQAGEEWLPSRIQPQPQTIGEFFKLLGKKTKLMDASEYYYVTGKATAVTMGLDSIDMTFELIKSAIKFSFKIWMKTSLGGELGKYGDQPELTTDYDKQIHIMLHELGDETEELRKARAKIQANYEMSKKNDRARWDKDDWIQEQSFKIVNLLFLATQGSVHHASDWRSARSHDIPRMWSKRLQDTLLLLGAIISCQMPLSNLEWIRERFVPVAVPQGNMKLLCLLAKHACGPDITSGQPMYIVGRHVSHMANGQDLVLATIDTILPVGLVPDFLDIDRTEQELLLYLDIMSAQGFPKPVIKMRRNRVNSLF